MDKYTLTGLRLGFIIATIMVVGFVACDYQKNDDANRRPLTLQDVSDWVCTIAVLEDPQSVTFQESNGGFSVNTSSANCSWRAVPNVSWITVTRETILGAGYGNFNYVIDENDGVSRTGTISVAGKTVTLIQSARP